MLLFNQKKHISWAKTNHFDLSKQSKNRFLKRNAHFLPKSSNVTLNFFDLTSQPNNWFHSSQAISLLPTQQLIIQTAQSPEIKQEIEYCYQSPFNFSEKEEVVLILTDYTLQSKIIRPKITSNRSSAGQYLTFLKEIEKISQNYSTQGPILKLSIWHTHPTIEVFTSTLHSDTVTYYLNPLSLKDLKLARNLSEWFDFPIEVVAITPNRTCYKATFHQGLYLHPSHCP